jgi:hypothetical protein
MSEARVEAVALTAISLKKVEASPTRPLPSAGDIIAVKKRAEEESESIPIEFVRERSVCCRRRIRLQLRKQPDVLKESQFHHFNLSFDFDFQPNATTRWNGDICAGLMIQRESQS